MKPALDRARATLFPARSWRAIRSIALALILVAAGLVNGSQAHVTLQHHGPRMIGVADAPTHDHGHSHDEPEPAGGIDDGPTSSALHDGSHHHVIGACAIWPAAVAGPEMTRTGLAASKPAAVAWATWPPHRPPCPASMP